jgi:hypothetical protein
VVNKTHKKDIKMYLHKFSVRIPGCSENNGYVFLKHNQEYKISIKNDHSTDTKACVSIDGKIAGVYLIKANSVLTVEHPQNSNGKFTFYKLDSKQGSDLQLQDNDSLGLISVELIPAVIGVNNWTTTWTWPYREYVYIPYKEYYPIWLTPYTPPYQPYQPYWETTTMSTTGTTSSDFTITDNSSTTTSSNIHIYTSG